MELTAQLTVTSATTGGVSKRTQRTESISGFCQVTA